MEGHVSEDLVTFLRTRLDAQHALATRIKERFTTRGKYATNPGEPFWPSPRVAKAMRDYTDPDMAAQGDLIEMFNPDRVLAEVKAKRAVIEVHQPVKRWDGDIVCAMCVDADDDEMPNGQMRRAYEPRDWPCETLRLLAQPYAGEPGWQETWRL